MKEYYVYIMASKSGVLYTGITNNLYRRVYEHKMGLGSSFTRKYRITKLVWFQEFSDIEEAIRMEKRIKGWVRRKKEELIKSINPKWKDLSRVGIEKKILRRYAPQNDTKYYLERSKGFNTSCFTAFVILSVSEESQKIREF